MSAASRLGPSLSVFMLEGETVFMNIPAKAGIQIFFEFPGFRVALAIARLPGMTVKFIPRTLAREWCRRRANLFNELQFPDTNALSQIYRR
jgi:hypothetical protein